jgi:hypothetical protein
MTEQELHQLRREKWRLAANPMRTIEDAREFIQSAGFCLMYPLPRQERRVAVLAPTFIGAYAGEDAKLPTWQQAFADPRAQAATELMVRLLREKSAFEMNWFGETNFLVSAQLFPYFYGLVGDRNPKQQVAPGKRSEYSPLARDAFEAIRDKGRLTKKQLSQVLGGDLSSAALDRALGELWSRLRITRVEYTPDGGAAWDALYRWAPELVREGLNLSVPESLSVLIAQFLETTIAAEQTEIEDLFSYFVPKTHVRDAVNAMLSAREFSFIPVGKKTMLHITQRKETPLPRRNAPVANRPISRRRAHPSKTGQGGAPGPRKLG